MNFKGKNILVVGESSGIGLSLVKFLHEDVTSEFVSIVEFLPELLHGLVYSVGSINLKPSNRLSTDDFLNDYRLNVLGAVQIIQQSLKQLKNAAGASIVLISSVAARIGLPYHASISAAKGGVEGLALALAAELATQQIRVNVVAPSLTETPHPGKARSICQKTSFGKIRSAGRYQPGDSVFAFRK